MARSSRILGGQQDPEPLNIFEHPEFLPQLSTEGRILPELAWKGFDAIQIPPAQVSPNGGSLVRRETVYAGASNGGSINLCLPLLYHKYHPASEVTCAETGTSATSQ